MRRALLLLLSWPLASHVLHAAPSVTALPTAHSSATTRSSAISGESRWLALRVTRCVRAFESSGGVGDGNYAIVSPDGRYFGAWQFSRLTFTSVSGLSGPATAYPAAVQDLAAFELWRSRGWQPWPQSSAACGV